MNIGNSDILLRKGTVLAQVHAVEILPSQVPNVELVHIDQQSVEVGITNNAAGTRNTDSHKCDVIPVNANVDNLSSDELDSLTKFLSDHKTVFTKDDNDYGCTTTVKHDIPTGDSPPVRERYRMIPPKLYQEVKDQIKEMLEKGVIKESYSPWAAPTVYLRKKDGNIRICVDYRRLNALTRKDAYFLPRTEESLNALGQAKLFSTLDLVSGYWQVAMDPKDRQKTAFTTPMGLFEFQRIPFVMRQRPSNG